MIGSPASEMRPRLPSPFDEDHVEGGGADPQHLVHLRHDGERGEHRKARDVRGARSIPRRNARTRARSRSYSRLDAIDHQLGRGGGPMVKRKDQSRLAVSTVAFVASTLLALTAGAGVARASGTPAGSLSPGSLTFADEAIGGTSAPQAISATNSGTASLFFNNVSLGGPDTLDFTIVTDHERKASGVAGRKPPGRKSESERPLIKLASTAGAWSII